MAKGKKPVMFMLIFSALVLFVSLIMQPLQILKYREYIDVLFPEGIIAVEQRNLLFVIQALMLLVIIPVYVLTFIFSWKYRAGNPKGVYDPDLVDNKLLEYIWWSFPAIMTLIISVLTWQKTHELDPYKPIKSDKKAVVIEVVALQWKWLFIYPEEKIATVNYLKFPEQTPIHFKITADAPMNSFWIPSLGGQIYAMPAMQTELFLMADEVGEFRGSSANISGEGFAGMHFIAAATSDDDFKKWVEQSKKSNDELSNKEYDQLVIPSKNDPKRTFILKDDNLFNQIVMKYMHPITPEKK